MTTCPSCGVEVPSGSRLCPSCGVALADGAEPEAGAALLLQSAEGFRQRGAVWEKAWSRLLAAETLLAVNGGRASDEAARALTEFERLRSVEEHERALRVLYRATV